jgi:hypothetical protein
VRWTKIRGQVTAPSVVWNCVVRDPDGKGGAGATVEVDRSDDTRQIEEVGERVNRAVLIGAERERP